MGAVSAQLSPEMAEWVRQDPGVSLPLDLVIDRVNQMRVFLERTGDPKGTRKALPQGCAWAVTIALHRAHLAREHHPSLTIKGEREIIEAYRWLQDALRPYLPPKPVTKSAQKWDRPVPKKTASAGPNPEAEDALRHWLSQVLPEMQSGGNLDMPDDPRAVIQFLSPDGTCISVPAPEDRDWHIHVFPTRRVGLTGAAQTRLKRLGFVSPTGAPTRGVRTVRQPDDLDGVANAVIAALVEGIGVRPARTQIQHGFDASLVPPSAHDLVTTGVPGLPQPLTKESFTALATPPDSDWGRLAAAFDSVNSNGGHARVGLSGDPWEAWIDWRDDIDMSSYDLFDQDAPAPVVFLTEWDVAAFRGDGSLRGWIALPWTGNQMMIRQALTNARVLHVWAGAEELQVWPHDTKTTVV